MRAFLIVLLAFAGCSKYEPSPRLVSDVAGLKFHCDFACDDNVLSVTPGNSESEAIVVFNRSWSEMNETARMHQAKMLAKEWKRIHGDDATLTVLSDTNEVILD